MLLAYLGVVWDEEAPIFMAGRLRVLWFPVVVCRRRLTLAVYSMRLA